MTTSLKRCALAIGVAGATTLAGLASTVAGPAFSPAAGLKAAASDGVIDVRWRRGGVGPGIAAGVAAGALAGAAIGAATAPGYLYGYPAYGAYAYPGYGAYYDAPVVYGSSYAYPYQSCGFYGGYGRWDYSSC